jgi:hypothetical protein
MRTMKKSAMAWSENGGMHRVCKWIFILLKHLCHMSLTMLTDAKCHKRAHHRRPSQMRKMTELEKRKRIDGCRRDTLQLPETFKNHHQQALASLDVNRNMNLHGSKTFWKHRKRGNINVDMGPTLQAYACTTQCISQIEPHQRSVLCHSSRYDTDSSSTVMALPTWRPYADTIGMHAQYQGFSQKQ